MSVARLRIVARLGQTSSELSPFVIGSLLAHGGFLVALLLMPYFKPDRPIPESPMVVDLVAAPGPPRPRVSPPAPPTPPPAISPPPKEASVETRQPPPVDPLPEKIEPVKNPKPRKQEPEPRPRRTAADPPPDEASEGVVADDGGASISPLEGGDVEFAWYRSAVTAALYGRWRRPLLERLLEPIEVRVSFEIQRDGSIRAVQVEQSSGVPTLDRSAMRAVAEASPLPRLPPNWRDPVLPATFIFRLHPE